MSWITPKIDWSATDRFNIVDYNRIKNNLNYLWEESQKIWGEYDIEDMGANLTSYASYWRYQDFNRFENNLETINNHMLRDNFGAKQTFYPNGVFIGFEELNRIENACLTMKATIDGWYEAMAILPFRLGNKGGIKE